MAKITKFVDSEWSSISLSLAFEKENEYIIMRVSNSDDSEYIVFFLEKSDIQDFIKCLSEMGSKLKYNG